MIVSWREAQLAASESLRRYSEKNASSDAKRGHMADAQRHIQMAIDLDDRNMQQVKANPRAGR